LLVSALALASCAQYNLGNVRIPGLTPAPQIARPAAPTQPQPAPGTATPPAPGTTGPGGEEATPLQTPPTPTAPITGNVAAGVLLPLSGSAGPLGQAMLNAAQMALYDLADSRLTLLTRDTQGTADGAAAAAQSAIAAGARIIIGPLLAAEVEAVKPIAQAANVPVLAFSTATQLAGGGVYLMGFTPNEEIQRITSYAFNQGKTRFAVLAPHTPYGDVVIDAVQSAAAAIGATVVHVDYYDPAVGDLSPYVRGFAAKGADYDALFLPEGGARLKALAPLLPYFNIDPDQVKLLGTGLWDDPGIGSEPSLVGGWFAAPDPAGRAGFESRYRTLYHNPPPRLATLGYDATALVAVLSRAPQGADFSAATLTNPNGFAGVDGIFRFRADGTAQRGFAILEVQHDGPTVIDPAPQSFQNLGF
jgi:ABC-type branched-subunit amino acid transport system substrate-binding protein